uniref:Paralithocin 3 n=1 Tax=Paralithodes camtschaticus TaxID=6741 RepID=AMP3_PARCM|nr:RecName: Full=Paralithocin 3; AltName: Full=P34; Flags: Precursor [Paralithodes camtschaticus]AUT12059.1 paralithocin 3 [Paralithodes camtschaticus]
MGPMKVLLVMLVVMVAAPHIADARSQPGPTCPSSVQAILCDNRCGRSACSYYIERCACCAKCNRIPYYGASNHPGR